LFPFDFAPGEGAAAGYTGLQFDSQLNAMLHAPDDMENRRALASVIFWGHLSAGVGFARRRVGRLVLPTPNRMGLADRGVAVRLDQMVQALGRGDTASAIAALFPISQLGLSFASKVVAFAAPDRAGVLDNRIMNALRRWAAIGEGREPASPEEAIAIRLGRCAEARGILLSKSLMTRPISDARLHDAYSGWCALLSEAAATLNRTGSAWSHPNEGGAQTWRAVDVERAIFQLALL
jgi:hypothetical protein